MGFMMKNKYKLYTSLARCCKYASIRPAYAEPVLMGENCLWTAKNNLDAVKVYAEEVSTKGTIFKLVKCQNGLFSVQLNRVQMSTSREFYTLDEAQQYFTGRISPK